LNESEKIKMYFEVWTTENNVKTNKLMIFFVVQTILATTFNYTTKVIWITPVIGIIFSFIWFFCIGRTVAFQKIWKKKIENIAQNSNDPNIKTFAFFPTREEEFDMPFYGKMPSVFITLLPPSIMTFLWSLVLVYKLSN
jgi:hypothetical protein